MNVDRGKTSYTQAEIEDLQQRLRDYKTTNGFTWKVIEKKTGVPQGTISAFATGSYGGDNAAVAAKIDRFFRAQESRDRLEETVSIAPGFQPIPTADNIHKILHFARMSELVVVVGDPGLGKTAALRQFAVTVPNTWLTTLSPTTGSKNAMLLHLLQTGFKAKRQFGSGQALSRLIRDNVEGRQGVIIVDEAQHASADAIEELRAIHDETGVGLALVGNREVLTRIEGKQREAAFAQLYSRVSYRLILDKPEDGDVAMLLNAWEIIHPAERAFLTQIAMRPGGGGLRQITKIMKAATLVATHTDEERCLSHLQEAFGELSRRVA